MSNTTDVELASIDSDKVSPSFTISRCLLILSCFVAVLI